MELTSVTETSPAIPSRMPVEYALRPNVVLSNEVTPPSSVSSSKQEKKKVPVEMEQVQDEENSGLIPVGECYGCLAPIFTSLCGCAKPTRT